MVRWTSHEHNHHWRPKNSPSRQNTRHTPDKIGGVGGGRLWSLVVVTCMWVPLSSLEVELKWIDYVYSQIDLACCKRLTPMQVRQIIHFVSILSRDRQMKHCIINLCMGWRSNHAKANFTVTQETRTILFIASNGNTKGLLYIQKPIHSRCPPTSYKWNYNPCK